MVAVAIAISGTYEQILSYVVSIDFIFFGLTGLALFVFRRRDKSATDFRVPGHPFTTAVFVVSCWLVVAGTIAKEPRDSAIGLAILFAGSFAYMFWAKGRRNAL